MGATRSRSAFARRSVAALVVGLVLVAIPFIPPVNAWLQEGGELQFVTYNANRTYRVEFHSARRWQRWVHFTMRDPGFVRLVDNCRPGRLTMEGGVVEFEGGGNGDVIWLEDYSGRVSVGIDTHFKNVPSLSSDCRVIKPEVPPKE